MKLLVSTTGPFMLIDAQTSDELQHNRPSVVRISNFIQMRSGLGQIKMHCNEVPDELTDKDFLKFWEESGKDEELAIQSFLASFAPKQVEEKAPPKAEKPAKAGAA